MCASEIPFMNGIELHQEKQKQKPGTILWDGTVHKKSRNVQMENFVEARLKHFAFMVSKTILEKNYLMRK